MDKVCAYFALLGSALVTLCCQSSKLLLFIFPLWHFIYSADFSTWNYYVTMPMPASTFTLAVGHWRQVTAEIPPVLEKGVRDRTDYSTTAKPGAKSGQWTEAEHVSRLGSSSSEAVKGSPLQTCRYFISFSCILSF